MLYDLDQIWPWPFLGRALGLHLLGRGPALVWALGRIGLGSGYALVGPWALGLHWALGLQGSLWTAWALFLRAKRVRCSFIFPVVGRRHPLTRSYPLSGRHLATRKTPNH